MRTLKFKVVGMTLIRDEQCNFDGLVPGSEGYIQAEFEFSPDWDGCAKVAAFYSMFGKEYPPQKLEDDKCLIPAEALAKRSFKIQVLGKKQGYKLLSSRVTVNQNGGAV